MADLEPNVWKSNQIGHAAGHADEAESATPNMVRIGLHEFVQNHKIYR